MQVTIKYIESYINTYAIFDTNGCLVEPDFEFFDEAKEWCNEMGFNLIGE